MLARLATRHSRALIRSSVPLHRLGKVNASSSGSGGMSEEVCCTSGRPQNNANRGSGQEIKHGGYRHYLTSSGRGRGIVLVHDIFGLDIGQTRQFADDLAAASSATVVMTDLFCGRPWSLANFPPPDKAAFGAWLGDTAEAGAAARAVLAQSLPVLRERLDPGARLGVLGFCWGGKVAMMLCGDQESGATASFACGASAHPAFLSEAIVEAVQVPIALLPASDDPDMEKLLRRLKDRPFYGRCVHRRYEGVLHGFCAARGDRGDPEQLAKIRDACQTLAKFFADNA